MEIFSLITLFLISLSNSSSVPKLKIENSCIKLKVGNSNITLALDPSSNVNYIFDGSLDKYKDKSYKKDLSLVLKTSSVIMTSSNVFGLFTGNLAVDEFYFPFIIDDKEQSVVYPLTFVLVKEADKLLLPDSIDGVLGLGYLNNNAGFYQKMNVLYQLANSRYISDRVVNINYLKNEISFGKEELEIKNKTVIPMKNANADTSQSAYPLLFYSDIKMGFSEGSTSSFDIDKNININTTFIPLWDNPNAIIAPYEDKESNVKHYLNKLDSKITENKKKEFYTDKPTDAKTALIFEDNYFVYDWVDSAKENKVKIQISEALKKKTWNINIKPTFNPEVISYDYDAKKITITNCKYCGKSKHLINFTTVFIIVIAFIFSIFVLCWCFSKYIHYRKDQASKFLKKYDLI